MRPITALALLIRLAACTGCAQQAIQLMPMPGAADAAPKPMPLPGDPLPTREATLPVVAISSMPSASPSPAGSLVPSPSPSASATSTATPTATPTSTPTRTPTAPTPTPTPSTTPAPIPVPTVRDTGTVERPSESSVPAFYKKRIWVRGVAVMASANVEDAALLEVRRLMLMMSSGRPAVLDRMVGKMHFTILGRNEKQTDPPEYAMLYTQFPGVDWNTRARGLGATTFIPVTSAGEENILCLSTDRYRGESITVHEFGHTVLDMSGDAPFIARVRAAYDAAMAAHKWDNTYATTNYQEYWAEMVQNYFDTNLRAVPSNGIHGDVSTRAQMNARDPVVGALLDEFFGGTTQKYRCP